MTALCLIAAALLLTGTASAAAPQAAFSGNTTSGPAPLTVEFIDESTGGPTGWAWYFGDETCNGTWELVNESAGWTERYCHTSVVLPDGSIVLMGGGDAYPYKNDVWRSTDGGATWTEVNAGAGWTARVWHTSVAMPDGSIVLMGGWDGSTYWNDVWRSTDNGTTWELVNKSAGWTARLCHTSVVLPDGNIVLMGGYSVDWKNDTWRSTDGGETWTQLPDAGWPVREQHTSVAMPDGSIVLMGGYDGSTYWNDVWRSTDGGGNWTVVNASPGWTARLWHTSVVLPDGSIVLMGGYTDSGRTNDTWRSDDYGATWKNITPSGGNLWSARFGHTSVVLPDGSIVLMGGYDGGYKNDVWRLKTAGSNDRNTTHTYTTPGTYTVTLQAYNDGGYNATRQVITVTAPTPTPTATPTPTPTTTPTATPTSQPVYSGGGGGGGSTAGPDGSYNVGGNSAVSKVNVTGTGLKTFIITGRAQSSPGAGIPPAPGIPYQYVDLVPARFETIAGATITFSVPLAWLDEHGFAPEEIVLYRYNGTAWEALPTTVVSITGTSVTFTATSPGFSLFAISGVEQPDEPVATPTVTATTPPATAQPTVTQTTAAPAGGPAPEFPVGTVAIIAGAVLVLAAGGYLVRRWWMRRQNPALFKDYD